MIRLGFAYAEDATKEVIDEARQGKGKSARRDEEVDNNWGRFKEMKRGPTEERRRCITAKIQYDSPNVAMRDPVFFRCLGRARTRRGCRRRLITAQGRIGGSIPHLTVRAR